MMQLILDIGSGKSLPDFRTGRRLIDEVAKRDSKKYQIVFKTQLFQSAPPNTPLAWDVFDRLFDYAKQGGYDLTSSVFDIGSLNFLLSYHPVFVKIACRPDLYYLIGEVQRKVPVYVSTSESSWFPAPVTCMICVPKYPADIKDYPFGYEVYSDHTVGWELFRTYNPRILEKHIVLERDPDNPDSGPFAILPEDLEGII